MLFPSSLCFSYHVRVEQVLAAPSYYFAVLPAGKKVACRLFILLVSWKKEKRESFVVTSYGSEVGRRVPQQRPLLISDEVSRSYWIIGPWALAYCNNFIVSAERSRVPALSSLHLVILLGRPVRVALQALRVRIVTVEIKVQITRAKHE